MKQINRGNTGNKCMRDLTAWNVHVAQKTHVKLRMYSNDWTSDK